MRIYSTLLLAALASWPFVAEAEVQKCVMQVGESLQGDMIAREIYLIEDPKTKSFMVLDAVVSYFNNKKPMVVRVTADDSVKRVFDWDVFMLNNAGQRTKIAYHGT